uniref:Pept_C1 domain-containing protein n=1 Tax=Caenorhabditis tropicalis TaxID=1561998 RepID=A0A1I7U4G7_9PELO
MVLGFEKFPSKNPVPITSLSITGNDLITTSPSPSFLSASPTSHPTSFTLANNTIDCSPTDCSTNSFLLNSPKHSPLLYQISNNRCRPPIQSPCVDPRDISIESHGITCRISSLVADCACTSSTSSIPSKFPTNISIVILGDCESLQIDKEASDFSQIYIFRTSKLSIQRLPRHLKILKIFHSTVSFEGSSRGTVPQQWEISNSKIDSISPSGLSNLHLISLHLNFCRLPYIPSTSTRNSKIENLIIENCFLETTQPLFEVSDTLKMHHSIIFSSPRGLGTIASAQLQNNTLLECCRHPYLDYRMGLDTIDLDPRSILPLIVFSQLDDTDFFEIQEDREHPEKIYKAFEEFKIKYNKKYKTKEENQLRLANFVKTVNTVDKLNEKSQKRGDTTVFGINKFADLSNKEFNRRLATKPPKVPSSTHSFHNFPKRVKRQIEDFPINFDLRHETIDHFPIIGDVKDQGECACCWGFAVTAMLESVLMVRLKRSRQLSDQELCDCAAEERKVGCSGGSLSRGLHYVNETGLSAQLIYPYKDTRARESGRCEADKKRRTFPPGRLAVGYPQLEYSDYEFPSFIYNSKLPIAVFFAVPPSLQVYKSGVYSDENCNITGSIWHAGIFVGFGEEEKPNGLVEKYWIMKNSWGEEWGEKGFVKIIRGRNWCNIEQGAVAADLNDF